MQGIGLIFRPETMEPEVRRFARANCDTLKVLQGAVGGHIELVGGFDTIEHDGDVRECAAFCNEEGKLEGLPINGIATVLWDRALKRQGGTGLWQHGEKTAPADVLVGSVIVVYGDAEFMAAL